MAWIQDPTRNSPTANRRTKDLLMARAGRHTAKRNGETTDKSSAFPIFCTPDCNVSPRDARFCNGENGIRTRTLKPSMKHHEQKMA